MGKLDWCKKQSHGIKKVQPSRNLFEKYIRNAEESLRVFKTIKDKQSKIWLATTKYYIEYFSVYAVFMRLGIKCEIHDCTVEVAEWLSERGIMRSEDIEELKESKELRIENQYYLKNKKVDVDPDFLSNYILRMKDVANRITDGDINKIRKDLFR